jgi:hypothetical protein
MLIFLCKNPKCGEEIHSDALNEGEILVCHECTSWHTLIKINGRLVAELFEYSDESFSRLKESFKLE